MTNLWRANHPRDFWLCEPDLPMDIWQEAILRAAPPLHFEIQHMNLEALLEYILGEAQFGPERYHLSLSRRIYYKLKPLLSQKITHAMRHMHSGTAKKAFRLNWPIEARYVQFLRDVLYQVIILSGTNTMRFRYFWPEGKKFAFVITHDVETEEGQRAVPILAELDESLGFRSSFNFVPERYCLDKSLMQDLRARGFEIGIHGLHHDSRLFTSRAVFEKQAVAINHYINEFQADGFRSPYTHRNPDWMQLLQMKYDSSFFDTDPFEPMPGGTMNVWPYRIGQFLELPYTMAQDCTLFNVLEMKSNQIWKEKLSFIKKYGGMALLLVHPDYSAKGSTYNYYSDLLKEVHEQGDYWHALPRDTASWWIARSGLADDRSQFPSSMAQATLACDDIHIEILPQQSPITDTSNLLEISS